MTEISFIAIDGGGSGSRAVLRRPGHPDQHATGGPANAASDPAACALAITDLVGKLTNHPVPVTAGIAGCRLPPITAELQAALPFPATLHDDSVTATRGALGGTDGTVISLGTGSFAIRLKDGKSHAIGGWGFTLGDEASGAWFGREALAATLRTQDGLQGSDALTETLRDPHPLLTFQGAAPSEFAKLAPVILSHMQTPTAKALVSRAVGYMTSWLAALGTSPDDALVITGGFGTALLPYLPAHLRDRAVPAKGSSLDGAIAMAEEATP